MAVPIGPFCHQAGTGSRLTEWVWEKEKRPGRCQPTKAKFRFMGVICVESLRGKTLSQTVRPMFLPSQLLSQTRHLDAGDIPRVGRRQGVWTGPVGSSD